MKYSFGMLKPDCIERKLEKEVFEKIESAGLIVLATRRVLLMQEQIDIIYSCCNPSDFYQEMSAFLMSGECEVFIVKGNDAINRLNYLVGYRNPLLADEGTIRRCFGENMRRNVIHSTSNELTFWREVVLFFA